LRAEIAFQKPIGRRSGCQKNISKPISHFKLGFAVQNSGDLPMLTWFSADLRPQILRNSQNIHGTHGIHHEHLASIGSETISIRL
jgi:hypothetical protein